MEFLPDIDPAKSSFQSLVPKALKAYEDVITDGVHKDKLQAAKDILTTHKVIVKQADTNVNVGVVIPLTHEEREQRDKDALDKFGVRIKTDRMKPVTMADNGTAESEAGTGGAVSDDHKSSPAEKTPTPPTEKE